MSDKTYNGHKNWAYWNVSLWLGNDEGLYNLARNYVLDARHRGGYSKRDVAKAVLAHLNSNGLTETPDGARYTIANLTAAIRGLEL